MSTTSSPGDAVLITCVDNRASQVRMFNPVIEDGLPTATVTVQLRGMDMEASIRWVQIYGGLPDFLESFLSADSGEWTCPFNELFVSGRVNEQGHVGLTWKLVQDDDQFGHWQVAVETWLTSREDVRRIADEVRALLPRL